MKITMLDHMKELAEINEEKVPDGILNKRRNFFYHAIDGKEVGITRNPDLISELCRKKYLLIRKKQLENNLRHFNKLDVSTPEEIIRSLPSAYQGLPKSYFFHPSIKRWLIEPYQRNPYPLKGKGYKFNGTIFRSKSESMIANVLYNNNIPYRYEAAIRLGNHTKYPDFIAKNPYTGKEFVWEHFGALHEQEYIQKMNNKLDLYMKYGYIPFKTLICTFETEIEDLDRIQRLIENVILG